MERHDIIMSNKGVWFQRDLRCHRVKRFNR